MKFTRNQSHLFAIAPFASLNGNCIEEGAEEKTLRMVQPLYTHRVRMTILQSFDLQENG